MPPENAWMDDLEQMDFHGSDEHLDAVEDSFPAVPAILFAMEAYEFPPEFGEGAVEALRDLHEDAMERFDPGEVRIVDSPHYMEGAIPEEVAAAVREVIGASSAAEASVTSAPTTSN